MKKFLLFLCTVAMVLGITGVSGAVMLTFSEETIPDQTVLDDTAYFSSFGVSFDNDTTFTFNSNFTEDGMGVYNGQWGTGAVTLLWDKAVSSISFNFAAFVTDVYAEVWDSSGNLLGERESHGVHWGTGLFDVSGISKLTLHNHSGKIGLDSIEWETAAPVPEPSTILLLGVGLFGLVGYNRKRLSKKS